MMISTNCKNILYSFIVILLLICNSSANEDKKSNLKNITTEKPSNQKNIHDEKEIEAIKDVLSKIKKTPKSKKRHNIKNLMFSKGELQDINKILNAKEDIKEEEKETKQKKTKIKEIVKFGKIYLSSILYLSQDKWSIWVNGNKISSRSNVEGNDIYIKSVTPYEVDLVWSLSPRKWRIVSELPADTKAPKLNASGQVEINVKIKANQTYILKYDKVVSGKI